MKIVSHIGFHKDVSKPSLSKLTAQTVLNLKNALSTIQTRLQAQDFTGMTKDDVLGSLLYTLPILHLPGLYTIRAALHRCRLINA